MTRPGIHKSLEAMQALCVSVIFSEHSFRDNPRNTQCSNATAIDCRLQTRSSRYRTRFGFARLSVYLENGEVVVGYVPRSRVVM